MFLTDTQLRRCEIIFFVVHIVIPNLCEKDKGRQGEEKEDRKREETSQRISHSSGHCLGTMADAKDQALPLKSKSISEALGKT